MKKGIPFIAVLGVLLVVGIAATLLVSKYSGESLAITQAQNLSSEGPTSSEETEGYEIININVDSKGYEPKNIEVKAGVPTKINFIAASGRRCTSTVESSDLDLLVHLQKGNNYVTLPDLKPGTYQYHCGMYMYKGNITVKE